MASKFTSDQGAKTQEYFVYFKFLQRRDGVNLPSGAEVVLISVYLNGKTGRGEIAAAGFALFDYSVR